MARYGINSNVDALGVPVHVLRRMAKEAGRDHALAESGLWSSGIHEARILAAHLIDDPTEGDCPTDGSLGARFRFLEGRRLRPRLPRYSSATLRRHFPAGSAQVGPRQGRVRPSARGSRLMAGLAVKAKSATDESNSRGLSLPPIAEAAGRRSQHGKEIRQLGAAADRQAQSRLLT